MFEPLQEVSGCTAVSTGLRVPSWVLSTYSVQLLSCVRLFATPSVAAYQVSMSIINSWSSLRLVSIESVMSSSHLIFCRPLLLLPQSLPTKVHLVKAMVFPVVMYGCESWTVKIAERRRIGAFELWCWRRLSWESLGLQGDPTSPS